MSTKSGLALGISVVVLTAGWTALPADTPAGAKVAIKVTPTHVDFLRGETLVGRYVIGPDVAKPYFWPLNAPHGEPITRGWPPGAGEALDHHHQKSAWFCHGDIIPDGIELKHKIKNVDGVDFWSENPGHGRIVCTKVGEAATDKSHGKVTTFNEWRTADGQKILDELRVIHLHDFGDAQLLVLDIDLNASVAPLTFGDTKEGSMAVRVRGTVTEQKGKGKLTNAESKQTEKEVWGLRSAWCDYSGPVGDKTAGITIFADPTNKYPTHWHSRGYGLMAANPFGRNRSGFPAVKGQSDLVRLAKGEHLKLRYGLLLHSGDVNDGKVAEYYERFTKLKG